MILETLVLGELAVNCYIVGCRESKEALVIDPGSDAPVIGRRVESLGLHVRAIVLTHGHWDHAGAAAALRKATGAELLCHRAEEALLADPEGNLSTFFTGVARLPVPDRLLSDGDRVRAGRLSFTVLHTPGHTPGGLCLHGEGIVFTGDTLFAGAVGRTDFHGGDFRVLLASIREKLLPLDDATVVYPGHGPASSIGDERRENPYLATEW
ncbi:MAG: MBL fold metallo-hydrolase [Bacillota bacterium]|nr:MBL fold metallo-hydrolase [Bacillota bacterium]